MTDHKYVQLYGGILARSPSEGAVAENEPLPVPKARKSRVTKRKSPSNEDEVVGTGKRGRPRVDPKDETAIERRRTQIRMAQRLYRQRKESTITSLEKRVAELKKTVHEMNQTFIDYNTKVTSSGIAGSDFVFGFDPKQTAQKFEQLAKKAIADSISDEEDQQVEESHLELSSEGSQPGSLNLSLVPMHTSSLTSTSPQYAANDSTAMLGYRVEYELPDGQDMENFDNRHNTSDHMYTTNTTTDLSWDQGALQQYRVGIPDQLTVTENLLPSISKFLGMPTSYAFLETSFARRLHRSSYERAYHVLTDPSTPMEEIEMRMRLSFCFTDLDRIVGFLRNALSKSDKEVLDQWHAPLLHVGNAGLHYSRVELENGSPPLPPHWTESRSIGPRQIGMAHTRAADELDEDAIIRFANCHGTWFDPSDVEQYLKTKGLDLSGRGSVSEVEIDMPVPALVEDSTGSSPVDSPDELHNALDIEFTPSYFDSSNNQFFDETNLDLANLESSNSDIPMDLGAWLGNKNLDTTGHFKMAQSHNINDIFSNFDLQLPTFQTPSKTRRVVINVNTLVETIIQDWFCIGRSPGYRKESIDIAFNKAMRGA